jgi:hypothetical protein
VDTFSDSIYIIPVTYIFTYNNIKFYPSLDLDKRYILSENKAKSGVYCFINKKNGNKYVGSSVNLRIRFFEYFNTNYLERNKNMPICLALLKYGYSNFSLEIVEYCEIPCVLY